MVFVPSTLNRDPLTHLKGYNQGVFSGVLTMPAFQKHMGNYAGIRPEDQSRKGWLTSILELGAWVGTLLSGFMAETASRKYGILIATGVFIVGVVVQATAISFVFRLLVLSIC